MTKDSRAKIIISVLILAVFSVIIFLIPVKRTGKFWFAYGCGVFAVLFQIYAILATNGREDTKERFYGFPVTRLAVIYLVLQLAVSIGGLLLNLSGWVIIAAGILFLVFPILGFITTRTMQAEIARQDAKRKPAE